MDNLIVGETECSFEDVYDTLAKSSTSGLLVTKWTDIARRLDIPSHTMETMKLNMVNGNTLSNIFVDILRNWKSLHSHDATLKVLVAAFEKSEMNDLADKLREKYHTTNSVATSFQGAPKWLTEFLNLKTTIAVLIVSSLDCKLTIQVLKCYCNEKVKIIYHKGGPQRIETEEGINVTISTDELSNCVQKAKAGVGKVAIVTAKKQIKNEFATGVTVTHHEIKWVDLTTTLQQLLMGYHVSLQSQPRPLSSVFAMLPGSTAYLNTYIHGQHLIDMLNKKVPELFKNTLPVDLPYYVPRTLISRRVISPSIFSDCGTDVFVFTGIQPYELTECTSRRTCTMDDVIRKNSVPFPFVILSRDDQFGEICKRTGNNVHHLDYIDNHFKWKQSKGNLSVIYKHIDNKKEFQEIFAEEVFLNQLLNTTKNTPICISDSPGMGKTVLLGKIARQIMEHHADTEMLRVVVYAEMEEFVAKIRESTQEPALDETILTYLANCVSCDELGRQTFMGLSKSGKLKIYLFLDGYDELDEDSTKLANQILSTLISQMTNLRLVITTRPNMSSELQNTLHVLGYSLQPFTDNDQKSFFQKFWSKNTKDLEVDRLQTYITSCLQNLRHVMTDSERDIAGIPLQCLLIAEVYQQGAIEYATPKSTIREVNIDIQELGTMYQKLIDKKLNQQKFKFQSINRSLIIQSHALHALSTLFPQWANKLKQETNVSSPQKDLLKFGLMELADGKPRFIHKTFADYLVAWLLKEWIVACPYSKSIFEAIFHDVLLTKGINVTVSEYDKVTLEAFTFERKNITYFLNSLVKDIFSNVTPDFNVSVKNDIHKTALACVNDDFNYLLKLFSPVISANNMQMQIYNSELLFLAVKTSSCDMVEEVANKFVLWSKKKLIDVQLRKSTLIKTAAERGDYSIIEYFLCDGGFKEPIRGNHSNTRNVLHACVQDTYSADNVVINQKIMIIRLLIMACKNSQDALIERKDEMGNTPLLCNNVHINLLQELISQGSDIYARRNNRDTLLHHSASYLKNFEYDGLIRNMDGGGLTRLLQEPGWKSCTPLHRVIMHFEPLPQSLDCFKQHNANFDAMKEYNESVLKLAIQHHRHCLQTIMQRSTFWNIVDQDERTLLHFAAEYGNLEAVTLFLFESKPNINIDAADNSGNTPLFDAILHHKGNTAETIRYLVDNGANIHIKNKNNETILHYAAFAGNVTLIHGLIKSGLDVNAFNANHETPIFYSLQGTSNTKSEIVDVLLDRGADVNYANSKGENLLHVAVDKGEIEIIKKLVQKGISVNAKNVNGNTPLHIAFMDSQFRWKNQFDIIKYLIDNKADTTAVNCEKKTVLHLAAKEAHIDSMKLLCEQNLNVNCQDNFKNTPLHEALVSRKGGRLEIVEFLLNNNADIKAENIFKHTPLQMALQQRPCFVPIEVINLMKTHSCISSQEIASLALERVVSALQEIKAESYNAASKKTCMRLAKELVGLEADINFTDSYGATLLHVAAREGCYELIKSLLEKGLNVNAKDRHGNTPLHDSLLQPHQQCEIVNILLQNGANPNELNADKNSPLESALKQQTPGLLLKTLYFLIRLQSFHCKVETATLALIHVVTSRDSLEDMEFQNLAEACVERNAKLTYLDEKNNGLLHFASQSRNLRGVCWLLKQKLINENINNLNNEAKNALTSMGCSENRRCHTSKCQNEKECEDIQKRLLETNINT